MCWNLMCASTKLVLGLNVGYIGTLVRLLTLRHECLNVTFYS